MGRRPAQPEPGEVLQRFVVQLSRPAPALAFGGREPLALKLGCDATRGRGEDGRAGREPLQQAVVLSCECRSVVQPVQGDQNGVGLVVKDERNDQAGIRADSEAAETVLVKASAVEIDLQAVRRAREQRRAGDRISEDDPRSEQTRGSVSGRSGDDELGAIHDLDQQCLCRHRRPPALGNQLKDDINISRAADSTRDLGRRLERCDRPRELVASRRGARVASRMIDREAPNLASVATASSSSSLNWLPSAFSGR